MKYSSLKNNKKTVLLILSIILFHGSLTAQEVLVKGKVTDSIGLPLIGVNVFIKGTTTGTITDLDGKFALEIPDANTNIRFTAIGYTTQDIALNGRTELNVVMDVEAEALAEVVVIGYGSQKKSDISTAMANISGDDLMKNPSVSLLRFPSKIHV